MERPRTKSARVWWLAVVIIALALTGCGGSGDSARTGASVARPASASPATTRADVICRRLNSELSAERPKSVSMREIETVSPRNAALEQRAVNELTKLEPPTSIGREWRQVIAYRRSLAGALVKLAQAAKAGDRAGIQKLGQSKARVRKMLLEVGERVGFTSCQLLG